MQGILFEEQSIWLFLLVSVAMGGSAAWQAGKSIAQTWRPMWHVIPYMFMLGFAVRFIHFALFEGHLFTLQYYIVDTIILIVAGLLGFRYRRARQMTTQYRWLYERTGPFGWRDRSNPA